LAGIRLGFAVASTSLAAALRQALGPWAVSGPAQEIGRSALADRVWFAQTQHRLAADAAALDRLLVGAGFSLVGGTSLFRLLQHRQAGEMFERLAQAGILVRPFADRPDWLRFGIPCAKDLVRLQQALSAEYAPEL
jgi:cobalamin biosynthesis protein CobC